MDKTELQKLIIERELARRSHLAYTRYMFKHYYKLPFVENWHHGYISEAIHQIQDGNITRLIINIPPSYGKCSKHDTRVLTTDGLKQIKDIKYGDMIYSYDDRKAVIQKCLGTEHTMKDSIKITMRSGREITISHDHPMLTFTGYKKASDITINDRIATLNAAIDSEYQIDEDELTFVTHMIFEGNCRATGNSANIRYTNNDRNVVDDFKTSCDNLDIEVVQYDCHKSFEYNIRGGKDGKAAALLKKYGIFGHLCYTKRLPNEFFKMSLKQKFRFLSIMFQTDGYVSKSAGVAGVTLANKELIEDIQYLLSTCGIISTIYYKPNKKANAWVLQIPRENAKYLLENIDFGHKTEALKYIIESKGYTKSGTNTYPNEITKIEKLNGYHARQNGVRIDHKKDYTHIRFEKLCKLYPQLEKYRLKDFYWDKIKKIEWIGVEHLVHIEVENTKNYIANGLVSHNTELTIKQGSSWMLGQTAWKKFIHTSYSSELSTKNSFQTRELVDNEIYRQLFPKVSISKAQDQKHYWETNHRGGMFATGTGGAVTGFHAHGIWIDDPTKAIEAHSQAALTESIDYLEGSLYSRLQDKRKGFIVLIMQRLNPKDLAGRLLEQGGWEHICLKALESRPVVYDMGKFHYERVANEPLWIEYEDYDLLMQQQQAMGVQFSSQYQQDPETVVGDFYTDEDFSEIGEFDIPEHEKKYIIIDPAMSTKNTADNRAVVVTGKSIDEKKMELITVHDVFFGTWELSVFVEYIIDAMIKYPDAMVLLELSGGGILVNQELSKEIVRKNLILKERSKPTIKNRIETFAPKRSVKKNEKLQAMQPYFRSHQIKFKRGAAGLDQLKKELRSFDPAKDSPKDDCMECLAESITNERCKARGSKKKEKPMTKLQKRAIRSNKMWRI